MSTTAYMVKLNAMDIFPVMPYDAAVRRNELD